MEVKNKRYYKACKLASLVNGKLTGDPEKKIFGVSGIEDSKQGYLTFAENSKKIKAAEESPADLVIAPEEVAESRKDLIRVSNPRLAYARISQLYELNLYVKPGVHSSSVISNSARLGDNISIHPHVVIAEEAEIGDNVILAPGVYVGTGVKIGQNSILHPNVVVEDNCVIGEDVTIHAGSIIGADGYGYVTFKNTHHKIAQLGNVVIGNNVEIGANVTIDRATSGSTYIGRGTKIDNLVQIAHNVKISENCLIIAQTGIAGSSKLQENVIIAGQVGIVDHVDIGNKTKVASKSLVTKNIPDESFYSGIPAHNHYRELKEQAARKKLPKLNKKIEELEKRIKLLEKKK